HLREKLHAPQSYALRDVGRQVILAVTGRGSVTDKKYPKLALHGLARRCVAADVGRNAGNDDGVNSTATQQMLEGGRIERPDAWLLQPHIAVVHNQVFMPGCPLRRRAPASIANPRRDLTHNASVRGVGEEHIADMDDQDTRAAALRGQRVDTIYNRSAIGGDL